MKCLEKDPARRYASATDLVDELGRFLHGEPILARPVGPIEKTWRWCKRNRVVAALTLAIAIVLIAGSVVSTALGLMANWNAHVAEQNANVATRERNRANDKASEAEAEAIRANANADKAVEEAQRATQLATQLERSLAAESEARQKATDEAKNALRSAKEEAEARKATRRALYVAQMNLAWQAWEQEKMARIEDALLAFQSPGSDEDLRGFEWYHLWWLTHRFQDSIQGTFLSSPSMWLESKTRSLVLRSLQNEFIVWDLEARKIKASRRIPSVTTVVAQVNFARPAVSPDATSAAVHGKGNCLQLWNLVTGKLDREMDHDEPVLAIEYSPDGKSVVAGGINGTLIAWDTTDGIRLWSQKITPSVDAPKSTEPGMHHVVFSPDGTYIATLGFGSAQLCDAKSGKPLAWLKQGLGYRESIRFSADSKFVVISSAPSDVVIWNVTTMEEQVVDKGENNANREFAISPNGRLLACGYPKIRIFDLATAKERVSIPASKDGTTALTFGPDSRLLASADNRGTIRLFDAESGAFRRAPACP